MSSGFRAGFVGLGNQGGPMAMRIAQAGIPLTVWARRPEVLPPFLDAGAEAADDLAQLGARSQVLGICVFGDRDVLQIADAVLPTMPPDSMVLIHSTVHPNTVRAVCTAAAARRVAVLDAPVSGGGAGAREGRLTLLIGGEASTLETARPVIETYAGLIAHLGGIGAGATAKLLNNAMMAANLATSHEAVRAGQELGLDREQLLKVIAVSSGASFAHHLYASREGLADFAHSVALLTKDVDLLESVTRSVDVDVNALAVHARHFFAQVVEATQD